MKMVEVSTFSLLFDGLGFRHGETLHGLVLLLRRVLLVRGRPGFTVGVRVDQHAAVKGVAVPVGRVAAPMIHWTKTKTAQDSQNNYRM